MRRLHPTPVQDLPDLPALYRSYRLPDGVGAHLRINMVSSLDGHIADAEGVSGSIGGDGDTQVFRVLRHLADGILVGAGTVRAEDYGGMVVRDELRALRRADGREGPAPIIVVTGSADLDPDSRLFESDVAPIIVTTGTSPADRREDLRAAGATVLLAGDDDVDLPRALRALREDHGLLQLLGEGGPGLNGQLLAQGLVDELCTTLGAALVGGDDERRIATGLSERVEASLLAVHADGDELLLRHTISRDDT